MKEQSRRGINQSTNPIGWPAVSKGRALLQVEEATSTDEEAAIVAFTAGSNIASYVDCSQRLSTLSTGACPINMQGPLRAMLLPRQQQCHPASQPASQQQQQQLQIDT